VPGGVRRAARRGECDFPELRALGARGAARTGRGAPSDAAKAPLSSRREGNERGGNGSKGSERGGNGSKGSERGGNGSKGSDTGAISASWATDGAVGLGLSCGSSSLARDAPAASAAPRRAASATHVPPVLEDKSDDPEPDAPLRHAPPLPRTKWTRRVPHPVLIGHAASPRHVAAAEPPAAGDSAVDSWLARTLAQPGGLVSLAAVLRRRPGGAPPSPRRARARPHAAPGAELVAALLEDAGCWRPSGREGLPRPEIGSEGRSSEVSASEDVSGPEDRSSGETPWLRGAAPQERRAAKFLLRAFAAVQHAWGLAPPPPPAGRPRPATRAELRAIDRQVHELLMPDMDMKLELTPDMDTTWTRSRN
jgi:hypothetical protein